MGISNGWLCIADLFGYWDTGGFRIVDCVLRTLVFRFHPVCECKRKYKWAWSNVDKEYVQDMNIDKKPQEVRKRFCQPYQILPPATKCDRMTKRRISCTCVSICICICIYSRICIQCRIPLCTKIWPQRGHPDLVPVSHNASSPESKPSFSTLYSTPSLLLSTPNPSLSILLYPTLSLISPTVQEVLVLGRSATFLSTSPLSNPSCCILLYSIPSLVFSSCLLPQNSNHPDILSLELSWPRPPVHKG